MTETELNRDVKRLWKLAKDKKKTWKSIEEKHETIKKEWKRLYLATKEGEYGNKNTILALISLNQTHRFRALHTIFSNTEPYGN